MEGEAAAAKKRHAVRPLEQKGEAVATKKKGIMHPLRPEAR